MKLNSKITWGLAWAGLAVIVAVPSADFITGTLSGDDGKAAIVSSDTAAVEAPAATSSVTTIKTKDGVTIVPARPAADPVDKLLDAGKALPDYISGGPAPAPAPAASKDTPAAPAEKQVAAVAPAAAAATPGPAPVTTPVAAPKPFPAWARPATQPARPGTAVATTRPVTPTDTSRIVLPGEEVVPIVDETTLTGSTRVPERPVPPASIIDDSGNWSTESLRRYLERNNLASDSSRSSTYDAGGYFLDEGPSGARETRQQRLDRLFGEGQDDTRDFILF